MLSKNDYATCLLKKWTIKPRLREIAWRVVIQGVHTHIHTITRTHAHKHTWKPISSAWRQVSAVMPPNAMTGSCFPCSCNNVLSCTGSNFAAAYPCVVARSFKTVNTSRSLLTTAGPRPKQFRVHFAFNKRTPCCFIVTKGLTLCYNFYQPDLFNTR